MNLLRFIAATMALAFTAGAAHAGIFDTTVDISPILQWAVGFGAAVLTILGGILLNSLRAYLDKKFALKDSELTDALQVQFDMALKKGIAYAESKLDLEAAKIGKLETGNVFIKTAGDYVVKHWPELLAKLDLKPEKVAEIVIRAMPSPTSTEVDALTIAKAGGQPVVEVPAAKAKGAR